MWIDDLLLRRRACPEAVTWARQYPTIEAAWAACDRGDWMLWWIERVGRGESGSDERRRLVAVACRCARLALPHVQGGEDRPRLAIETAERWAAGDPQITPAMVLAAAGAAWAAAWAAGAAGDAAGAAWAAWAARAAAGAARAAAGAAEADILRRCADLVRAEYPAPPVRQASHA